MCKANYDTLICFSYRDCDQAAATELERKASILYCLQKTHERAQKYKKLPKKSVISRMKEIECMMRGSIFLTFRLYCKSLVRFVLSILLATAWNEEESLCGIQSLCVVSRIIKVRVFNWGRRLIMFTRFLIILDITQILSFFPLDIKHIKKEHFCPTCYLCECQMMSTLKSLEDIQAMVTSDFNVIIVKSSDRCSQRPYFWKFTLYL